MVSSICKWVFLVIIVVGVLYAGYQWGQGNMKMPVAVNAPTEVGITTPITSGSSLVGRYSYGNRGVADVELRADHTGTASGSDFGGSSDFSWTEGQGGVLLISNWQAGARQPTSITMSVNGKDMTARWPGSYEHMFKE